MDPGADTDSESYDERKTPSPRAASTYVCPAGGWKFECASHKGRRDAMEDYSVAVHSVAGHADVAFFGVFDGHGGKHAAEATANPDTGLLRHIVATDAFARAAATWDTGLLQEAVTQGCVAWDAVLCADDMSHMCGTTAVFCFVTPTHVIIGNVGDSAAIVFSGQQNTALLQTRAHKPTVEAEARRIRAAGATVAYGRVDGNLAVSRAFGDVTYKAEPDVARSAQPVIAVPDVYIVNRVSGLRVLLVSDGILDMMDLAVAAAVAAQAGVTDLCLKCRYGMDNVTALLVSL